MATDPDRETSRGQKKTPFLRRGTAVLACAVFVSGLKLLNLCLPVPDPFMVINPAAAILAEGIAAAFILTPFRQKTTWRGRFGRTAATSFAWRLLYAGMVLMPGALLGYPSVLSLGLPRIAGFFFLEGIGNTVLILAAFPLIQGKNTTTARPYFPAAALMLTAAVTAQILF